METIKKGSKGDAVKVLQKALGMSSVDGDFGSHTESVLIEFQKKHSLTPDGVCGNNTWKALGIGADSKCVDSSVFYSPLPQCVTEKKNRKITYLVIHFTGGSHSEEGRAKNVKNTFLQRLKEKKYGSADFAVDDVDMVQFNPDLKNYYCWAVGGSKYKNNGGKLYGKALNNNCISIEICSTCKPSTQISVATANHSGWSFTEATLNNAIKLSKILMKKYDISIDKVIRHYDVTGKLCPGIVGWNDEPMYDSNGKKIGKNSDSKQWEEFKKKLI